MIAITPQNEIQHGPRRLAAGKTLIVEDVTAGEILIRTAADNIEKLTPNAGQVHDVPLGGKLLIVRPGGFGDILFLTPVLAAIKAQRPDIETTVCTFPGFGVVLDHNPTVHGVADYPLTREAQESYDVVCWLEDSIERGDDAHEMHIVDIFAKRLGITLEDKACRYTITVDEAVAAGARFPRTLRKRVGIQVKASARCRTYPPELLQEVINRLILEGREAFLFGLPHSVGLDQKHPQVINLTQEAKPLSFRESCAVLATCDGVIAPDSALCHVAGALRLPTVALYGPFPWQHRVKHHASVYGFNGHCPMSPCFHHERAGDIFPEGGPCRRSTHCDALASIQPERIVGKLNQLLK